jgi:predicted SAM-dependent methyltransferase/transcription elongation factor Elf1
MKITKLLRSIKNKMLFIIYNKLNRSKDNFSCPICNYYGPFLNVFPETGRRRHAKCPKCGALERHRLQYLVLNKIFKKIDTSKMGLLHFAPEDFFIKIFRNRFKNYITADLYAKNVDRKEDITCLSFIDNSFDFIFASHVLEHVKNDLLALSEIKRVLKPSGIAIIPVPIVGKKTVEYPKPNPYDNDHVRSPGEDYYNKRYRVYFNVIKLYKSSDFDERYQLYIYEDRTKWQKIMPLIPSVPGVRHTDIVPVCYK